MSSAEVSAERLNDERLAEMISAAMACDKWPADISRIVDIVTENDGEMSTEQAVALGILLSQQQRRSSVVTEGMVPTHRHVKRGTEYVLIGIGKMQTESWGAFTSDQMADAVSRGEQYVPVDMREVAIYRSGDDGSLWARPVEEFNDGRFIALPTTSKEAV